MKLWFVSREAYNRVLEELRRSEAERKDLLDKLLAASGVVPLQALEQLLPAPDSKEAEEMVDPQTGALSIQGLKRMAQTAADKRILRVK